MTTRKRTTWTQADHSASAAPAMPTEEGGHPASSEDPGVDDYKTGDPSSWAEDVHPGPYGPAQHPSMPTEDGDHPATKRAATIHAAEVKASKCIRMASAMLGTKASREAVEHQALAFMHLDDSLVEASLGRLSQYGMDDMDMGGMDMGMDDMDGMGMDDMDDMDDSEAMLDDMLAEFNTTADDDEDDDDKEASALLAQMLAEDDEDDDDKEASSMLAEMLADDDEDDDDKEASSLLAEMLGEDDDQDDDDKEASAILAQMIADQNDPRGDTLAPGINPNIMEEAGLTAMDEMDIIMDDGEMDPMGLMDEGYEEDAMLAEMFGARAAGDDDSDDDDSDDGEEEEEEKEGGKKATTTQRPQPRKQSRGPRTIGGVAKVASSDENELSRLWEHAPDVSKAFGM